MIKDLQASSPGVQVPVTSELESSTKPRYRGLRFCSTLILKHVVFLNCKENEYFLIMRSDRRKIISGCFCFGV